MTRPAVVVVSDHASVTGGAEMVAITSAVGLAEAGFEVTFVAGSEPRDDRLSKLSRVEVLGATGFHQSANKAAAFKNALWNRDAEALMTNALKGLDPDNTVVHLHSYLNVLSPSVLSAALREFGCTITLHDYGIVCPTSGLYNHRKATACPLTPLSAQCIFTQCSKRSYFSKAALVMRSEILKHRVKATRRIDHYIAVSRRNGEIVYPFLGKNATIHHVRNPYQKPQAPRVMAEKNGPILFVGRLTSEKDPVRLALAAKRTDTEVVFVGSGPLVDEVRAANPDATITGWLTQDQVAEWFQKGRANVMTSRWHEGSPLSLTDAAAQGLPSIVPSTMAGAENVQNDRTGYLYALSSDEELDRALRNLKQDHRIRELSEAAYDGFWADPPTMEAHIRGLEGVYHSILG